LYDFECSLTGNVGEERKHRLVRYRTPARASCEISERERAAAPIAGERPGVTPAHEKQQDRRIRRTRALLHEALGSLLRERAYDRITVTQILARAGVSRSTFYIHFRDKDELLLSSMRALLCGALPQEDRNAADSAARLITFSLPLLTHIQHHRRSAGGKLGERGRAILHQHLRRVLSEWVSAAMQMDRHGRRADRMPVVPELLAQHIASTFVLILHWWLDHGGAASAAEADSLFRALVMPVLR
jgi:AcrR family transcriptional regulator